MCNFPVEMKVIDFEILSPDPIVGLSEDQLLRIAGPAAKDHENPGEIELTNGDIKRTATVVKTNNNTEEIAISQRLQGELGLKPGDHVIVSGYYLGTF